MKSLIAVVDTCLKQVRNNNAVLLSSTQKMSTQLVKSVDKVPVEMLIVVKALHQCLAESEIPGLQAQHGVNSVLFLRFFCPQLVAVNKSDSPEFVQSKVQVAKALQLVANNVSFLSIFSFA